ncbi:MAG: stage II sporulation protein R [Oscillospiraceae bacterium]|nr:stage II sporulation protein R [Oscillospiraceae bacterium]
MKKKVFGVVLMILAVSVLLGGFCAGREQQALADKLIRLHVVANSDSEADQAIKLQVRDAVLDETQQLLDGAADPRKALADNLDRIEAAANRALAAAGSADHAAASLGEEMFPTREYETFSLPAGAYTALRVTIGAGEGHNWWCVVFPSLCMSASMEEMEAAAQAAGLTEGEIKLITEESEGYVLKFKTMEWLQRLKEFFED